MLTRSPLLLNTLDEAKLFSERPKISKEGGPKGISGLGARAKRHLRIAAIGMRRAGLFGPAGVPGMRRQVRAPLSGLQKAAAGMYVPLSVLRTIASAGARRGLPFGRYKYGRRGLGAAAAIRYRYGRGGIY